MTTLDLRGVLDSGAAVRGKLSTVQHEPRAPGPRRPPPTTPPRTDRRHG